MRGLSLGIWLNGIIVGVVIGLTVAWVYWPVTYTNSVPADLNLNAKDDYLRMIAASYSLDGDLPQALQRLQQLQLAKPYNSIASLVQREPNPLTQQALIRLAIDLKQPAVAMARSTFTPRPTPTRGFKTQTPTLVAGLNPTATPSETVFATPSATLQAVPTATATATNISITTTPTPLPPTSTPDLNAPLFEVQSVTPLNCIQTAGQPRIIVQVSDADGQPVPGIGVEVNSSIFGNQLFYTGLKPERGTGIGDVAVVPGSYSVHLVEHGRSRVVTNLKVDADSQNCTNADPAHVYGWKLLFEQPPSSSGFQPTPSSN